MNTKRYIVALKKGVDYNTFWREIETNTIGLSHIPDRAVSIANNRDSFLRLCEYELTDDEAALLRKDPRVAGVELPIKDRNDVKVSPMDTQTGNFTKPSGSGSTFYSEGTNVNWGLIRHSYDKNVYGTGTTTPLDYEYSLDGTGVDIVISDSGIQADHPEFQYVNGVESRVQQIDWAEYYPPIFYMGDPYQDPDGHGTHVAGIAAGKTYGWAKGSLIYSIVATGPGAADPMDLFEAVKIWHLSKTNGRPTVLNMSWAFIIPFTEFGSDPTTASANLLAAIDDITYRGITYTSPTPTDYGLLVDPLDPFCVDSLTSGLTVSISPYDIALEELIDNGVVVVRSAGNSSYKIDVPGGDDYDNSFSASAYDLSNHNYQQGYSPKASDAIVVGSLDASPYSETLDQRVAYSCAGPGVDVYAAGTFIMSAGTNVPIADYFPIQAPYFLNSLFYQLNIGGTSMAAPQVAGIACLYLQINSINIFDSANSLTVKNWITLNGATPFLYTNGLDDDYLNPRSLLGGNQVIAYSSPSLGAVEVYVGGTRVTSGYSIVDSTPVTVVFDTAPPAGAEVKILVRRGVSWYAPGDGTPSDGVPLQMTNTEAARFLRGLN